MKARQFVFNYWFDKDKPSKAVTEILRWIKNGKLTSEGKKSYKILLRNVG